MGAHLTKRDASRFKAWHAGLLALLSLALSRGSLEALCGRCAYDAARILLDANVTAR